MHSDTPSGMDLQIHCLATSITTLFKSYPQDRRLLVFIGGPPGCGKSTIINVLLKKVNLLLGRDDLTICVSLDGFHLTRAELDASPDPNLANARRGAPFTFDLGKYQVFLDNLQDTTLPEIQFSTFDHAAKDPLPSAQPITPAHRIVIVEGLYTLLDRSGWRECALKAPIRVWIEVDDAIARQRVIQRNFEAGLAASLEEMIFRVDTNDALNADEVRSYRVAPTHIISSL